MANASLLDRDQFVSEYVKRRANGICDLCGNPAPFKDNKGRPYLESHHIFWLSKGGVDTIYNTVALVPSCHKKMHILDSDKDVEKLLQKVKAYKQIINRYKQKAFMQLCMEAFILLPS